MLDEDGPVELVIIMSGTNDLGFGASCSTIMQHLSQLHAVCHQRGNQTVAMAATYSGATPQRRQQRQQLADAVAKWASATASVLDSVDVEELVVRPVGKNGASNPGAQVHWETDDLHLSPAGSMALGRRLASHVSSWLQRAAPGKTGAPKRPCTTKGSGNSKVSIPASTRQPLKTLQNTVSTAQIPQKAAAGPARTAHRAAGCGLAVRQARVTPRAAVIVGMA